MQEFDVFADIAERTGGDVYIGVVGPVRSGKSTFVRRFIENLVLPNIEDPFDRQRAVDELPMTGPGRTILTAEPKFVPDTGVTIRLSDALNVRVRLVDSVGFPVEGAFGYLEEEGPRMVRTPWFDYEIPFEEAADVGTRKVIADHSTIGIVITTDGSFGDLPRSAYEEAEMRAIEAAKAVGRPFVVLLNSAHAHWDETRSLAERLAEEHGCTVLPVDCLDLDREGMAGVLEQALYEFPVREVDVELPGWVRELPPGHWLREDFEDAAARSTASITKLRDVERAVAVLRDHEGVASVVVERMDLGTGFVTITLEVLEALFYRALEEIAGVSLADKQGLMRLMRELVGAKKEYDKFGAAIREAGQIGYGMTIPSLGDLLFEEPELVKKSGQFGVRLQAHASSFHVIRADVVAEYTPILGTEKQSEDLVQYLMEKFQDDPKKIWESNIFGKPLSDVLREGIRSKLQRMPDNAQRRLQETVERIVNEGSGGLICIIL